MSLNNLLFLFLCFIYTVIFCLLYTLLVASITLLERKLMSIVQRRVGPDNVGYHGRLQYIADALKLLAKGILIPDNVIKLEFSLIPFISIFFVYMFWTQIYYGSNIYLIDLEYNTPHIIIISILFAFSVISVGIISRNKFTMLASFRFVLITINNELLLGLLWVIFSMIMSSVSFSYISSSSYLNVFFFTLLPALVVIIVCFLADVGRTPFDFGESESELVAGYTTELSGFLFVLYYLGEYFHLLLMSSVYSITIFNMM